MNLNNLLNFAIIGLVIVYLSNFFKSPSGVFPSMESQCQPDDLFTDGLDHPFGIKKQNRHHTF